MIKAETKDNEIVISFEGEPEEIMCELIRTLAKGVEVLNKGFSKANDMDYSSAFYATVMNAADKAHEYGYDLNLKQVGVGIYTYAHAHDDKRIGVTGKYQFPRTPSNI